MMELSLQEKEIIFALRKCIPFERIEIMKMQDGSVGADFIIFTSQRVRVNGLGDKMYQKPRQDL
jgi:hypothetical protein